MSQEYTMVVQESSQDMRYLAEMRLAVAFMVTGSNQTPTANIVHSTNLAAPNTSIRWRPSYYVSWCRIPPSTEFQLELMAGWQPCQLGQQFNIDETGNLLQSGSAGPGTLEVTSHFQRPTHIVIGTGTAETGIVPMFADTRALLPGNSQTLQPQTTVQLWFDRNVEPGRAVPRQTSKAVTFDMANAPNQTEYFRYDALNNRWEFDGKPFTFEPKGSTKSGANLEDLINKLRDGDISGHDQTFKDINRLLRDQSDTGWA